MSAESEPPTKVQKLDNEHGAQEISGDVSRDYDAETQKALEEIDACQNEIDGLNEKASEEILCVEQKYNKMRKPHYDKRSEHIHNVPNFWLTAFVNHPQISAILDDEEEECLHYLTKVDVEEFEDIKSGYRIKFHFSDNPYFTNSIITKEFNLATTGDPASESTTIKWKPDMDLVAQVEEKQKSGQRNSMLPPRTFFQWFNDNEDPAADDIAEIIKDDMWPNPLQYFLAPDVEVEENGINSEDYGENAGDSGALDEDDPEEDFEDEDELDEEDEGEGEEA